MLSLILYGALAVVVAVVVVSVLVVVLPDDTVSVAARDRVPAGLPASGEVDAHDVDKVRLPVVVRGYRMVDTDAVLDRLSAEIDRRDQEIAALRAAGVAPDQGGVVGQPAAPISADPAPIVPPPAQPPPADLRPADDHPSGEQPWPPPPLPRA